MWRCPALVGWIPSDPISEWLAPENHPGARGSTNTAPTRAAFARRWSRRIFARVGGLPSGPDRADDHQRGVRQRRVQAVDHRVCRGRDAGVRPVGVVVARPQGRRCPVVPRWRGSPSSGRAGRSTPGSRSRSRAPPGSARATPRSRPGAPASRGRRDRSRCSRSCRSRRGTRRGASRAGVRRHRRPRRRASCATAWWRVPRLGASGAADVAGRGARRRCASCAAGAVTRGRGRPRRKPAGAPANAAGSWPWTWDVTVRPSTVPWGPACPPASATTARASATRSAPGRTGCPRRSRRHRPEDAVRAARTRCAWGRRRWLMPPTVPWDDRPPEHRGRLRGASGHRSDACHQ